VNVSGKFLTQPFGVYKWIIAFAGVLFGTDPLGSNLGNQYNMAGQPYGLALQATELHLRASYSVDWLDYCSDTLVHMKLLQRHHYRGEYERSQL
jgi:hypothetical protein